ncbi:hypothetical protein ABT352_04660 [Streptosporangium sp. NPDC000563]|uniref:hypothetical protein n=1 Tax=Streptosporangium sp. NPDC000563 TaxID=3154366 RepID=UPI0033332DE1
MDDEYEPPWHSCPTDNCEHGSVDLAERPDVEGDGSPITGGSCDQCDTPAVQCSECENLIALLGWNPVSCDACGVTVYQLIPADKKGTEFSFHRVS